jgi:RNA polymerase sigma factor for flagellar operon FliA
MDDVDVIAQVGPTMEEADPPSASIGEAELWRRHREERDESARDLLIARFLPYARTVAATYYARRTHDEIEFDEYLQLARLGMLEALDRYDPAAGAQFKTYAARRMHGAILDGLEKLTEKQRQIAVRRHMQNERLQSLKTHDCAGPSASGDGLFQRLAEVGIGLALGFLLEDTGMYADEREIRTLPDNHYQQLELRQTQRHLRDLVAQLPEVQRMVIRNHYLQNQPFDEIASQLGLSKGRISQIHKQALGSMRQMIGARQRCDVSF